VHPGKHSTSELYPPRHGPISHQLVLSETNVMNLLFPFIWNLLMVPRWFIELNLIFYILIEQFWFI
jgi:hypothetical protein